MELAGKVVVVTGGAGNLGSACAREAARQGARVVVADLAGADVETIVSQIHGAGGEAVAHEVDISSEPAVVAMVEATKRGYELTFEHPAQALDDLIASVPGLDRGDQAAQLHVLLPDLRPAPFKPAVLRAWAAWDLAHGLLERPLDVKAAFEVRP